MGDTLNPLQDYGDVPAIDHERNLENLYSKVDKMGAFGKLVRQMKNLSRYIPNIHPVTRQNQIAGTIPRKAFASVTYSDKKILEFVRELTSNIYSNYSSMELVLKFNLQKKQPKLHKWMEV